MIDGEHLALTFDRDGIEETGLDIGSALNVIEAFRRLAEYALFFRTDLTVVGLESTYEIDRAIAITLRAAPVTGSIKLPLWVLTTFSALDLLANASQVTGTTLRDAFAAIAASHGGQDADDEITKRFTQDRETNIRLDALFKAATAAKCSYVAVEWRNEVAVIHGARTARLALITSHSDRQMPVSSTPTVVMPGPLGTFEVYHHGGTFKAFVTDRDGRPMTFDSSMDQTDPAFVIIWASEAPIPAEYPYSLQVGELDPLTVTHGPDLPWPFLMASRVFIVTGASELKYR